MTYASGGLIQASDFNNILGGSSGLTGGGTQFNPIWGTGFGNVGYGQTTVSNVSVSSVVTASSWADLVNKMNNARNHQAGTGTGITAPSAGGTVTYLSTLTSSISTIYTNRLNKISNGSTVTGSNDTWNPSCTATGSLNNYIGNFRDCNVVFASVDQARWFFNAGGYLNFTFSAVDNAGTTRSQSLRDAVNALGGIGTFAGYTNSGRTGAGGSISTNNTSWGYWTNINNSEVTIIQSDDVNASYSGYNCQLRAFTQDAVTTNGANGATLVFRIWLVALADDAFGGAVNLTITSRLDVVNPETTYLTNTWGTPTVTYDSA